MGSDLVLILVVVAGVAFDFTNGFHDTANAMATSIATGALKPKVAVIGGVIGATIVAASSSAVNWHNLVQSVIVPALLSPIIAGVVAFIGVYVAYRIIIRVLGPKDSATGYRFGQIGSASLVSLAHGTNDAQKTMGVISLALTVPRQQRHRLVA